MKMEDVRKVESWISNYVKSAYAKGVVIGMSGGKDSLAGSHTGHHFSCKRQWPLHLQLWIHRPNWRCML